MSPHLQWQFDDHVLVCDRHYGFWKITEGARTAFSLSCRYTLMSRWFCLVVFCDPTSKKTIRKWYLRHKMSYQEYRKLISALHYYQKKYEPHLAARAHKGMKYGK